MVGTTRRGSLSSDLSTSRSQPWEDLGGKVFQAEGAAGMKFLRRKAAGQVQGTNEGIWGRGGHADHTRAS